MKTGEKGRLQEFGGATFATTRRRKAFEECGQCCHFAQGIAQVVLIEEPVLQGSRASSTLADQRFGCRGESPDAGRSRSDALRVALSQSAKFGFEMPTFSHELRFLR